jgi:NAD(P)H-dependent FMN reductase
MDAQTPLHIAVIIGSTREGRHAPRVADWFTDRAAARDGMTLDVIDLAEVDLPFTMTGHGRPRPASVAALGERLARADAFVVITPEYNHSFPAPLKNAIDWYGAEWANKPVAFVSYGGVSGGLRAVQQLRHVFIELRATPIRDTVSFHDVWSLFDADGSWPKPSDQREQAVATLLDQLAWSAATLRAGREGLVSAVA